MLQILDLLIRYNLRVQRVPEIFISYSTKDEKYRSDLASHLAVFKRTGEGDVWHFRRIDPGGDWAREIDDHIRAAAIIVLLISKDFIASHYCFEEEFQIALERRSSGDADVLPVILKPCAWDRIPSLSQLQALPLNGKPIVLHKNQDSGWNEVAHGVGRLLGKTKTGRRTDHPAEGRYVMVDLSQCGELRATIEISRASDASSRLEVEGFATWHPNLERLDDYAAHTGEFSGEANLGEEVAVFKDADCEVRIQFVEDGLRVTDNSRCGGLGVTFSGEYRREAKRDWITESPDVALHVVRASAGLSSLREGMFLNLQVDLTIIATSPVVALLHKASVNLLEPFAGVFEREKGARRLADTLDVKGSCPVTFSLALPIDTDLHSRLSDQLVVNLEIPCYGGEVLMASLLLSQSGEATWKLDEDM